MQNLRGIALWHVSCTIILGLVIENGTQLKGGIYNSPEARAAFFYSSSADLPPFHRSC